MFEGDFQAPLESILSPRLSHPNIVRRPFPPAQGWLAAAALNISPLTWGQLRGICKRLAHCAHD